MRRLVAGAFLTLDGVMQAPGGPDEDREGGFRHGGWLVPYFDEKFGEIMSEWTKRAGAFVLGRKTYEMFAGSWPKSTDPADGGEIQVHNSGHLLQTLFKHDLVDALRIRLFPVVLGTGKRLFSDGTIPRSFRLISTQQSTTGAVLHVYDQRLIAACSGRSGAWPAAEPER